MANEEHTVKIVGGGPYGIRIKGGAEFGQPISIENVTPGSKGGKAGLMNGDVIISINDVDVKTARHDVAKNLIAKSTELVIVVKRGDSSSSQSDESKTGSKADISQAPAAAKPKIEIEVHSQQPPQKSPPPEGTVKPKVQEVAKPPAKELEKPTTPVSTRQKYSSEPPPPANVRPSPREHIDILNKDTTTKTPPKFTPISTDIKPIPDKSTSSSEKTRMCHGCKAAIGPGKFVQYCDRFWHEDHFSCHECNKNISQTRFYEKGENILCGDCFGKLYCKKCENCHQPCLESSIVVGDKSYHDGCFKCSKCNKSLSGEKFDYHDDRICCHDCISSEMGLNCHTCSKMISVGESYVQVEGNQHHSSCLKCHICNAGLGDKPSIKMKNGQPCCPSH